MFHECLKRIYVLLLMNEMLNIYQSSHVNWQCCSGILLSLIVALFFYQFLKQEWWISNSNCSFVLFSFHFMYSQTTITRYLFIYDFYEWLNSLFYHYEISLSLVISLPMKSTLSYINTAIPVFIRLVFTWFIFLHPFNSSVFLYLNEFLLKVHSYV